MDMKEKILATKWLSGKKRISNWLIYLVALFGVAAIAGSLWLGDKPWKA